MKSLSNQVLFNKKQAKKKIRPLLFEKSLASFVDLNFTHSSSILQKANYVIATSFSLKT